MAMSEKVRQQEIERRADQEYTFEHGEGDDRREFRLKSLNTVPAKFMRETRKLDQVDQMFTLLEALADDETMAVIDEMPRKEFNDFAERWQKWSQVDVGESSASST